MFFYIIGGRALQAPSAIGSALIPPLSSPRWVPLPQGVGVPDARRGGEWGSGPVPSRTLVPLLIHLLVIEVSGQETECVFFIRV